MIPHTYVLRRYSKEAKSDVNFDRRDRPIAGPDGVKLSYRTKVLSLDAQQLVKWGRRSSIAFERATSVMKGLRNQLEEIPADVHGLDPDDGVSEHEVDVGDGAGPSIHRGVSAGDEISRRPPPKSMTKGRGSDPNETVRLGAPGPKKCTRGCSWCGLKDGHNVSTCPKNPSNFERLAAASSRGKRKSGQPRGGGSGGSHG
ncbi:hypothetical protein OsJ_17463 [Oryza sativa Japonica Group]|uniref:Uncharacterized protein n=1 Tax=Oryza sativa subsp. japonica TaxID=39947 RepID=B9FMZ0_ORYSJ|nr:hypothetical protein OsJ_17463 [Oryza sativa Japonica Group]KAF2912979.1 hypothetical protein DAI22_10g053232 [Oryza sativa Japonica Group]